jgi:hypothetical protein
MQTLNLSEAAVFTLRTEIRGYRMPVTDRRLAAYRELAAAGIMEPVPGSDSEYRFTDEGMEHREEILQREAERIESERFEPPVGRLSESAREQLRRCLAGDESVTERNRPAYRELAAARIMIPAHSFVGGREAEYRFTYWGWRRRFEFAEIAGAKDSA